MNSWRHYIRLSRHRGAKPSPSSLEHPDAYVIYNAGPQARLLPAIRGIKKGWTRMRPTFFYALGGFLQRRGRLGETCAAVGAVGDRAAFAGQAL